MNANAYKIENDVVVNLIVVDTESDFDYGALGYILDETGEVRIGWVKIGDTVVAPPVTPPSPEEQIQAGLARCIDFGNSLFMQYSIQNALAGIGVSGKRKLIADTLRDVHFYAQVGLLVEMKEALQAIVVTPEMAPFITEAVVSTFIQQIDAFLAEL